MSDRDGAAGDRPSGTGDRPVEDRAAADRPADGRTDARPSDDSPVTLAVASSAETYERLRDPLGDRGVAVRSVRYKERSFALADPDVGPDDVDVGLVFPGRVMEGGVVDAALDVPWVNDRETVLRSRNKAEVLARLGRAGLPVPETVCISNPVDEETVAAAVERVGTPAVVKPNSTTRGTGVAKVTDLDSAHGVTDYLELVHDYAATGDRSYLVQEFLPDARDYRVMVVDGAHAGAVERRLSEAAVAAGRWKHNVHRGAEARGVTLSDNLRDLAERAADALDFAYVGVDLLVTGDRAVVNETNVRPTVDDAAKYEDSFYDDLAALVRGTARQG